jgi:small Trp-rich protein
MLFLLIGLILLGLWWAGVDPVATWPWWAIGLPFALTVVWWAISDATGATQKRAMKQLDERVLNRRLRSLDAMGLGFLKDKAKNQHKHGKKPRHALPDEPSRHDSRH